MDELFDKIAEPVELSEDRDYPNGLTIFVGGEVSAPEGYTVIMTVDGAVMPIVPGDYQGHVHFQVKRALNAVGKYTITNLYGPEKSEKKVCYRHPYRPGLLVDTDDAGKTHVVLEKSLDSMFLGSRYDDVRICGGGTRIRDNRVNSIMVLDGDYRVENMSFDSESCGGDDFELFGATIAAAGRANVVVDHVDIRNRGVISTALTAGEYANLLVSNSRISSSGTDNSTWWPDSMTEAPWVLGVSGTVRTINVVDSSTVVVYNSEVSSNGWGVYSSDDTAPGAKYVLVNSKARIERGLGFHSGYGLYSLNVCETILLGADIKVPTYGVVICSAGHDTVIGPSSRENLVQHLGEDSLLAEETNGFASIQAQNSVIRSNRFGVLWHNANDKTLRVLPGTSFETGKAVFLIKASEGHMPGGRIVPPGHPTIEVDGAQLRSDNGMLALLMESDDAGIGTDCHDKHWASYYVVPDCSKAVPVEGYNLACEDDVTAHVNFRNMTLTGDIYNTRCTTPQNLAVRLDNIQLTGVISSGIQNHVNRKPGQLIYPAQCEELGNVEVTPAPAVVNGVILKMTGNSTWTVTGNSYLTSLTVESGSVIAAPKGKSVSITVNGAKVERPEGCYQGCIIVEVI